MALGAERLRAAAQPDPIGLSRWTTPPVQGAAWPPPHWLPVDVVAQSDAIAVDWAWFGAAPLTAPFFEGALRRALARPLNRLFRYRTNLNDFLAGAETDGSLTPDGFIFHVSRCGSTLVAQLLAALPQTVVVSEAAPIDAIVRMSRGSPRLAEAQQAALLRAMVAAYGRRRAGDERRFVIKLDAWHTLALPLFRRAFPGVPWLFLYRDPVEVLVSQMRERGTQTVPQLFAPAYYDLADDDGAHAEDYCARLLARICTGAADHSEGGLFVNYRELPEAVETRILPWFALSPNDEARTAMALTAQRATKAPDRIFEADSADKQRQASGAVRAAAAAHLSGIYRRLEELGDRGRGV